MGQHEENLVACQEREDREVARETLQRVTRLETRIVQLGDHVGANLRSKQRIDIQLATAQSNAMVNVDSLDVSVSRILTELRQHGVNQQEVPVFCGGSLVFTIINRTDRNYSL